MHYCYLFRDECELLPIAVPVLLSTPHDAHYAIRATTLSLVGELAEWIDQHPDTLELVLKFILDGLNIPAVATYAAKAVQSVCLKCKQRMAPHIDLLLQVIQAADKLSISNDAVLGLLKGITEVLSRMAPDEMKVGIHSLCRLHVANLQQVILHVFRKCLCSDCLAAGHRHYRVKGQLLGPLCLAGSVVCNISVQHNGLGSWTYSSLCTSCGGGVAIYS